MNELTQTLRRTFLNRLPKPLIRAGKRFLRDIGLRPSSLETALKRLQKGNPNIATIVDIGAAVGAWSEWALEFFPNARLLMLEPLEERRASLTKVAAKHPNAHFKIAAAGSQTGKARFSVTDDLDGSGMYGNNGNGREVDIIRVDQEVKSLGLPGPYLIKFDTHGFELPILEGCSAILPQTEVIIMEVYNFKILGSPTCIRFPEMVLKMESMGFSVCDILEPIWRNRDGCLWQFDLIFRRSDAPLFNDQKP